MGITYGLGGWNPEEIDENVVELTEPSVGPPTPTVQEVIDAMDPEGLVKVLAVGAGLVQNAGGLWDALIAIPEEDPAYQAVQIVTDVALTAALTELE